jgi:hypothetical protein
MASLQRLLAEEKFKELRPESTCNLSEVPRFLFPNLVRISTSVLLREWMSKA